MLLTSYTDNDNAKATYDRVTPEAAHLAIVNVGYPLTSPLIEDSDYAIERLCKEDVKRQRLIFRELMEGLLLIAKKGGTKPTFGPDRPVGDFLTWRYEKKMLIVNEKTYAMTRAVDVDPKDSDTAIIRRAMEQAILRRTRELESMYWMLAHGVVLCGRRGN